jgi:hypothetical protein
MRADDLEFVIVQRARLVEDGARNGHLADVMHQAGYAQVARQAFRQSKLTAKIDHQRADRD